MKIKENLISTFIHVSWVVLLLVIFYYFFIEKIETHVAQTGIDYLIDSVVHSARPAIMTIPPEMRHRFKMEYTPVEPEKKPEKPKKFFEGSYGKMRAIMLAVSSLLIVSIIYFYHTKQYSYLKLNIAALVIAIFVVLTEFFFAGVVTPNFYSIDSNETLSYIFDYLDKKTKKA